MINCIYQLTSPKKINLKYEDIELTDKLIVKPTYMSICHADQRYTRASWYQEATFYPGRTLRPATGFSQMNKCLT